jgi:hypothetical protein
MKNLITTSLFISSLLLSSCATIVGGAKYNAHVVVNNRPNAKIMYQGEFRGTGTATFKVKRSDADKFSFLVKEDNCNDQSFAYTSKTFRTWAFIGTLVTWTFGIKSTPEDVFGFPIPLGAVVDFATGALWKPNVKEKGIMKEDVKTFRYIVDYTGCTAQTTQIIPENNTIPIATPIVTPIVTPIATVYLKNGSITKGTVLEHIPSVQVKIQTKDGNIFVYQIDEIEKITKD